MILQGAAGAPLEEVPLRDDLAGRTKPNTMWARGFVRLMRDFVRVAGGAAPEGEPATFADGLVVQHGFPAPPTLLRARTRGMPDAQIFNIISNGTGSMPYYSAQIAREDRWKAVLYVRKLQNDPPPPPAGDAK